jgi:hypothetical protein
MSCDNDCDKPVAFPRRLFNRPALPRIDYRIGAYGDMRAHMLSLLDQHPALAAWTHRGSDDPGIALLESAAVVGDILSLYQDDYANESYLRSASLDDSVTGLVRLLGYRPAPGIGGVARFALAVKGTAPVAVPAGLALDAQLEGADKPSTFETTAAITAIPALSAFHLHRPRQVPAIVNGMDTFQLGAADGVALQPGDRVMVGLAQGDAGNAAYAHTQVLEVDKAWDAYGVRYIKTKGGLQALDTAPIGFLVFGLAALPRLTSTPRLVAWKLGGDFHHFGHTAPTSKVVVDSKGRATTQLVGFTRVLDTTQVAEVDPDLSTLQWPLDSDTADLSAGITVLVQARLRGRGAPLSRLLARRVKAVASRTCSWGGQSGASTLLTLDADLAISEGGFNYNLADIRELSLHAVTGAAFELRAAPLNTSAGSGHTLDFYGSSADAKALLGRTLLLLEPAGPAAALVQQVMPAPAGEPRYTLTLDRPADYALYPHDAPAVTVHGNLVDATQGKTVPDTVLGDGDGRATYATYALPKAPLTYLLVPEQSPPQRPELEVRVDGLLWDRVESFFDSGPLDNVYIVREDAEGKALLQFGDGVHGARVPSGRGNIVATYRTGNGSKGPLKAGASVSAKPRLPGFDKAFLPEPVTGGAAPEPASSVRMAAPGTMQSLGRIVSLADCETEAQSLPGVLKARASWALVDAAPVLVLTVLTDGLANADRAALDAALRAAFAARGPATCALRLRLGNRRFAELGLTIGHDTRRRSEDLLPAVRLALGTSADSVALDDLPTGGLFDWRERNFGQDVHGSQVLGRVQAIDGVAWVELTRLANAGRRTPSTSPVPLVAAAQRLVCPADSLLALHNDHLAIAWVPVDTGAAA